MNDSVSLLMYEILQDGKLSASVHPPVKLTVSGAAPFVVFAERLADGLASVGDLHFPLEKEFGGTWQLQVS